MDNSLQRKIHFFSDESLLGMKPTTKGRPHARSRCPTIYNMNSMVLLKMFYLILHCLNFFFKNLLAYKLWFLIMCFYEFCVFVSVCMCISHFFLSLLYSCLIVYLLASFLSNQRRRKHMGLDLGRIWE